MGLLDLFRSRSSRRPAEPRGDSGVETHLRSWARERTGVEAYVEPQTFATETTVVLVAHDGEWTRRRIAPARARKLAKSLKISIYDVQVTGYPQRMREHDRRERTIRKRMEADELRGISDDDLRRLTEDPPAP